MRGIHENRHDCGCVGIGRARARCGWSRRCRARKSRLGPGGRRVSPQPVAPAPPANRIIVKQRVIIRQKAAPAAAPAPAAPVQAAVTDPWAVVSAYFGDVTSGDYAGAWALRGFGPPGEGYSGFAAGYADTGGQTVTENWEQGDQVSFDLESDNPDGSVQYYTGVDTVVNGVIVAANVTQTG
jgi:hypothetical protein